MQETIAVVAFDGISPFHLSVPCAVFGEDRREAGVPRFEVLVCAAERNVTSSAGFGLTNLQGLGALKRVQTVIVPSWRNPNERPPQQMLDALAEASEQGATVVGLCLGSFVLAAAGLLNGRRATTHWLWAAELSRRYPEVDVDQDVLYVDEEEVITSAGGAAGIDCCLHLLRKRHGAEVASIVARRLVVPPHRQGGQAQYVEKPLLAAQGMDRFTRTLDWVQQHLEQRHALDALADRACMSRRTFTRRFRQATGVAFKVWLIGQRLTLAQRLLETTYEPLALIAQQAGFGSEANLRLHFAKVLKTSPARYRREFHGP